MFQNLLKRAKQSQLGDNLTPEEYKSVVSGYRHNFPNGIPECGTDGLRFSLLSHDIQSKMMFSFLTIFKTRSCFMLHKIKFTLS